MICTPRGHMAYVPEDMSECVLNAMRSSDVQCRAEIIHDVQDWHSLWTSLGMNFTVHGFAITESEDPVSHSTRFIRRADLPNYLIKGHEA